MKSRRRCNMEGEKHVLAPEIRCKLDVSEVLKGSAMIVQTL